MLNQSLPTPPPSNNPNHPGVSPASPPAPRSEPEKIENRSDFGQFWSDSVSQASTLNPPPLWALQPDEPAADYQLFAAWLQLPPPRRFRKVAQTLGCPLYRLRRLSARRNWKTRAAAFDQHRAHAASAALDQLLQDHTSNWKERVECFRLQEWLLHEQMIEAARVAIRQFQKHPGRASFRDILALYDLGFTLARRACGMPLDYTKAPATKSEPPPGYLDAKAALEKIYGQPLPGEPPDKPSPSN